MRADSRGQPQPSGNFVLTSNKLPNKTQSGPLAQLSKLAQSVQSAVHRHPRRVSAAVLAIMTGTAVTVEAKSRQTTVGIGRRACLERPDGSHACSSTATGVRVLLPQKAESGGAGELVAGQKQLSQ